MHKYHISPERRCASQAIGRWFVAAAVAAAGMATSVGAQDKPKDAPKPVQPADKPVLQNVPIGNAPAGKTGLTQTVTRPASTNAPSGAAGANNTPQQPGKGLPTATPVPAGQPGANPNSPNAAAGTPGAPGAGQPGAGTDPAGAGGGEHADLDLSTDDPDLVTLADFSGPIELPALVELVARVLNINIVIHGELGGTVVFNAPVRLKKDRLMGLLDSMLEQQDYTITYDAASTFYNVVPLANVKVGLADTLATTRVFSTPNIRPSALKTAIEAQVVPPPPSPTGGQARQIAYIDELGVIVATDTPRRLDAIGSLVDRFLAEFAKSSFIRLELQNIAAPVARERALQLIGQVPQRTNQVQIPGMEQFQQPQQQPQRTGPTLDNLGDRLTVDPQGNALIFRGLPEEITQVRTVLSMIDVTNVLVPKQYFAGTAASQIADIAQQQGFGEVTTIKPSNQNNQFENYGFDYNSMMQQANRANRTVGGPVMVVDEARGTIIYYGTPQQHQLLDKLIAELDLQSEKIVIRGYKLKHSDAEKIAEVIMGLLNNQSVSGEAPLLPDGSSNMGFGGRSNMNALNSAAMSRAATPGGEGGEEGLMLDNRAFVIADTANNQVMVKAPSGQQADFKKLIEKLDLRRPQVYIEAQIVAVTTDDRLRMAFETQLINANGTGGVLNTNFGLGSFATGSNQPILDQKIVGIGTGFTGAIIRSSSVPIIMQALANETDSRVVASPRILVDDNEEASIVSTDQQPVTTISRGNANQNDIVTSDYVDAQTNLTVTPKISEGGYLRLAYEITLSTFTGESSTVGGTVLPPPRTENVIQSKSITIPHDGTVVVGGLVVDQNSTTIAKIPLLGDIPIVGRLFQNRAEGTRKTVLYVFLTPRILRDPEFDDLRLLTEGPAHRSKIPTDIPDMEPTSMELLLPRKDAPPEPAPETTFGNN